jgi:uncharacterized protein
MTSTPPCPPAHRSGDEHTADAIPPYQRFIFLFDPQVVALDNDCACPDAAFGLEMLNPPTTTFVCAPDTHVAALPHGFRLAFSPFAPAGPSVLNLPAWERYQTFAGRPQSLAQPIDYDLAVQRLILPAEGMFKPVPGKSQTLTAWLHITNACNLDCPYCYVRKSSARMEEATGLNAVEQIFAAAQNSGFRRVKLKYAGGEATLHFKLVQRLHARAQALAAETGLELREVVLSNGVFLPSPIADWLDETRVKLMISLDGVGVMHDQQRPMKGGGDTFARIERNVDMGLLPRGIRPDITITLTGLNAHGAADAVRWALARDLPFSLNFYRQNVLSASRHDLALEEAAIIEGLAAAYRAIEANLPTRPLLNGLLDRVQAEAHSHTCSVGQGYVVVTHTGQAAQCQMHLEEPISDHIDSTTLLPLLASGPIRNLPVEAKIGCRDCTYRYRCAGGCPLETFRATGRWDVQSPNCNIYQTLFPQALRLEGLRLMKAHGYLT